MVPPRIDVVDPSPEGVSLVEALRRRGFDVRERSIESLDDGCDASLLLLAGDTPGAMGALDALRTGQKQMVIKIPVILLGRPPEDEADGAEVTSIRHFDADAYYPRPVPVDRVVRKVETYLSPPETHLAPVAVDDQPRPASGTPVEPEGLPPPGDEPAAATPRVVADASDTAWSPRERTVTLGDLPDLEGSEDSKESADLADLDDPATSDDEFLADDFGAEDLSGVEEVTGVSFKDDVLSIEDAAGMHDAYEPVSQVARREEVSREVSRSLPESAAVLSPRLAKIFSEADRRIFPDSSALDLELPDHQESARELVPDDLLEVVSMPSEAREEDPLEAFTYVGAPPEHVDAPLPMPEAAQRYQRTGNTGDQMPSPPRPARTEAGTFDGPGQAEAQAGPGLTSPEEASRPARTFLQSEPTQHSIVGRDEGLAATPGQQTQDHFVADELEQVGVASEEEVLRILFSVAGAHGPVDARFERPDGSVLDLSVAGGRLTRISGRVHGRAVEELFRQGRVDEVPAAEGRAVAVLDERVAAGLVGRFEADRLLRRVRESEIHDLVAEVTVSYDVTAASALRAGDPGLLAVPLAVVLAEGARRRIGAARLRQLMGGGALVVEVRRSFAAGAERLGLEPELAQAIERHDGADLDDLLGAAPAEEGLAGALYALWAIGAVGIAGGAADRTEALDPSQAVQAVVEAAHALAEEGSYFDVLGVSPDAMLRELRMAYVDRRRELRQIDLEAHGLTRLTSDRRDAIAVVEEAWEVLRDEGVRAAYRRALGL